MTLPADPTESAAKLFTWLDFRQEQVECVVLARSKAAVGRLMGCAPRQLFNLTESGSAAQRAVAEQEPGAVFYRSVRNHHDEWRRW